MFARMLIRKKILYSTVLLTLTLLLMMYCSLRGVFAYRSLTKSIGHLSYEFQEIWNLSQHIDEMRSYLRQPNSLNSDAPVPRSVQTANERIHFLGLLVFVRTELNFHERRIQRNIDESDPLLATSEEELALIATIRETFQSIEHDAYDTTTDKTHIIDGKLEDLGADLQAMFKFLTDRMYSFREEMRLSYHTWIAVITFSAIASLVNVVVTFLFFRHSVVQPFKILLSGSRSIAGGQFDHRIQLRSQDELAELGDALNDMTERFVQIRNNLNEKVQQRTREVVRSEQLASVGFLAAGVAHEINNPLASIAWSAEALESRLHEVLHQSTPDTTQGPQGFDEDQIEILRKYLRRIQDEAFRCKGITERLLDFSRLGESQKRQETDIHEALTDVISLVKHLGEYRNRAIVFVGEPGVMAWVSPTEFKQVVLNLLTNSLDASEDGGVVRVTLESNNDFFTLMVVDQGCGMTEDVLQHLFEPFFTRRRDGRGTGLGLSITYRIVQDHGGTLVPLSPGAGLGSTFELKMPLNPVDMKTYERLQAA